MQSELQSVPEHDFKLSPEALEITNTYLTTLNIQETADTIGIPREEVISFMNKREVRSFIDQVFLDQGYLNRFKIQETLETIIASKLEEAEESEIFTNKDLVDLLTLQHKMRMDYLTLQAKVESQQLKIQNQTNVQLNTTESSLDRLMEQIIKDDNIHN